MTGGDRAPTRATAPPRPGPFDMERPARLAVLISGGGRTLMHLASEIDAGRLAASIDLVIASRDCTGGDRARARKLPTLRIPGRIPVDAFERVLVDHGIDWVVLAGYLSLVEIPDRYRGRVVNIHPALLPAFGGQGMYGDRVHRAVLNAARRPGGPTETGCPVHLGAGGYDTGAIGVQRTGAVHADDTPESLASRVFEQETLAYPEAIRMLLARE